MGVYACSLQKNKTLTIKLIDGSEVRIAQTKYLCRAGQLHQSEWTEKGEKLAHPEFMRAVNRIENGLEKDTIQGNPFHVDYVNIVQKPYKLSEIDGAYIQKIKEGESVRSCYYDDCPSGVEKETYMVIKTPKGFVILELDHQKNFNFIKENEYLWEHRLSSPILVRINDHYNASVYNLASLYEYLTGFGKNDADSGIRIFRNSKDAPQWFINAVEFMCIHKKMEIKTKLETV